MVGRFFKTVYVKMKNFFPENLTTNVTGTWCIRRKTNHQRSLIVINITTLFVITQLYHRHNNFENTTITTCTIINCLYHVSIITSLALQQMHNSHVYYRTWSKGSKSPSKQTPHTSLRGNTIPYNRIPSPTVLENDWKQSPVFQRSYSTSAALPAQSFPEISSSGNSRIVQNLAEAFRFQVSLQLININRFLC